MAVELLLLVCWVLERHRQHLVLLVLLESKVDSVLNWPVRDC
jgi:hypothetical protein